ncbi:lytic transglycosylase domain-containing protein [Cronobacter malonaticus]|nr:lytic transglycosylase domain-containing protein [Cronobacter malonaticus]MEB8480263.1 lytic transglycosylase domain-containing protein [Cronobacter malonaticus]
MANYRDLLEQAGARHGVPEGLMTALGAKESSYNPAAVSSAGAVGLTQVMPGTWRDMGYTDEQMQSPEYQADAGARYLAKMYQQFGNWRDALQAYHDGPGNVMKAKRGEYTPGPEGRGYVDDRFAQWAGDPVTDTTAEQRATSAKVHPQQDPNNPFAQLESQSSEQASASGVQSDPNNPFAQLEQQAASQQTHQSASSGAPQPVQQQGGIMSDLGNGIAETGRGLLQAGINVANIPAELTDAVTSAAAWAGNKLGIGDGTYQPAPRVTTQGLEQDFGLQPGTLTPQTTEGRIFAEALPYLTPVGAERFAASASTLAGRVANSAGRLTAENVTGALAANSGEDGSASKFIGDLGAGVAAGSAINLAAKGIGAGVRALGNRGLDEAASNLRKAMTQGSQPSNIDDTARIIAGSTDKSILQRNVQVGAAAPESASLTPQIYRAAEEVRPNQSIIDAAKRLGMDGELLPSHFSNNPTYRAIEQGLKSVPASQLAAKEHLAISSLSQKADDLIEMAGGQQNRLALSDKFKSESVKAIEDLAEKSDAIYSEISSSIPKNTPMTASKTLGMLNEKAKTVGGVQYLSAAERKILNSLSETKEYLPNNMMQREWKTTRQPTYGLVDNIRKQIGAAISKNQGPFKDQTSGELKRLYSAITDDQAAIAAANGMGEKWQLAKSLVSQRKQLEDHMVTALGKDLSGTFSARLTPAVQNIRKGNVSQFNQLLDATPPHMRQEVVASALNDAFTLGSRKEQQLNIPGFVDWYSGAQRNGSLSAVTKYLPHDATKRLHDLYTVANGIRTAKTSEISTGRIQSLLDQFDKEGGMISKIYNIGKKAAAAEGVTTAVGMPGFGTVSVIASTLGKNKTARTVAADQLIASNQFRNAAKLMAGSDIIRSATARANVEKALMRSNQYKKWAATLDASERQAIAKVGLIAWLQGTPTE